MLELFGDYLEIFKNYLESARNLRDREVIAFVLILMWVPTQAYIWVLFPLLFLLKINTFRLFAFASF